MRKVGVKLSIYSENASRYVEEGYGTVFTRLLHGNECNTNPAADHCGFHHLPMNERIDSPARGRAMA